MWSPGELLESVGWVILIFAFVMIVDFGVKDRLQTYYAFGLEKSRSAKALQLTARRTVVNFRFRHVALLAWVIQVRYWFVDQRRSNGDEPELSAPMLAGSLALLVVWGVLNMLDGRREVDALLAAEPPAEES